MMHLSWRLILYLISSLLSGLLIAAALGHAIRDINPVFFILMHLPLPLIALIALLLDGVSQGHSLPLPRFTLTLLASGLLLWSGSWMLGTGQHLSEPDPTAPQIRVLHWNVNWGGGKLHRYVQAKIDYAQVWDSAIATMQTQHPDIIMLNEPPQDKYQRLTQLHTALGTEWHLLRAQSLNYPSNPRPDYQPRDKIAILARWPLQQAENRLLPNGEALLCTVAIPQHPLRLLVIDGNRDLQQPRDLLLNAVQQTVRDAEATGHPISLIAGDFNAISRSRGFDGFADLTGGFHLASQASFDWRATWIATLPLYDIDHIWVHHRLRIIQADVFTNWASDHRGQIVELQ